MEKTPSDISREQTPSWENQQRKQITEILNRVITKVSSLYKDPEKAAETIHSMFEALIRKEGRKLSKAKAVKFMALAEKIEQSESQLMERRRRHGIEADIGLLQINIQTLIDFLFKNEDRSKANFTPPTEKTPTLGDYDRMSSSDQLHFMDTETCEEK